MQVFLIFGLLSFWGFLSFVGYGGYVGGGWLRRLCGGRLVAEAMWWSPPDYNAILWLHLASWNLQDSQLS